jgi:hypothetical protein
MQISRKQLEGLDASAAFDPNKYNSTRRRRHGTMMIDFITSNAHHVDHKPSHKILRRYPSPPPMLPEDATIHRQAQALRRKSDRLHLPFTSHS